MSFDITIKTPGTNLPDLKPGEFRYVLGRDGLCLERCTPMYTSTVKIDRPIPFLEEHPQQCQLHCGPIPSDLLQQMVGFFQTAYRMHGGEAALILLYYPATGRFAWHCPKQKIEMYSLWGRFHAEDSVEYDNPLDLPEDAVQFGDAHSHTGPPNPSLMDQNDEAHLDGLHIIVGYIKSPRPSWHIDFCIDGNRFAVPPEIILEAIPESPFPDPPEEWMEQIELVYPAWYKNRSHSQRSDPTHKTSSIKNGKFHAGSRPSTDGEDSENQASPPAVPRLEGPREEKPSEDEDDQ